MHERKSRVDRAVTIGLNIRSIFVAGLSMSAREAQKSKGFLRVWGKLGFERCFVVRKGDFWIEGVTF